MIRYRCVAVDCPLPDEIYQTKQRQPLHCALGHCRIEPMQPAQPDTPPQAGVPQHAEPAPQADAEKPPSEPPDDPEPAVLRFANAVPTAGQKVALIVGGRRFPLPNTCRLGRQGDAACDAFGGDLTVSRLHALLTVEGSIACVENISKKGNVLVVNGVTLSLGGVAKLDAGRNRVRFGPTFACEIELVR